LLLFLLQVGDWGMYTEEKGFHSRIGLFYIKLHSLWNLTRSSPADDFKIGAGNKRGIYGSAGSFYDSDFISCS
jgi:hypothetical protein